MKLEKDEIKKQIRELINQGHIAPEDIPSIELYMDQVTTFMDKYLSGYKRNEDDKTLTKTMINNYTKNDLLPPPDKKKYGKDHIIILIYIYYLKNIISIGDIQTLLQPLLEGYYDKEGNNTSLEKMYQYLFKLEQKQYFDTENSIIKSYELAFGKELDTDDELLRNLCFISLMGYDMFMKKKLIERMVDDIAKEREAKANADTAAAKKDKTSKDKASKDKTSKDKAN
ncbi:MAG: DUF1836 domain-containing protein [Wujia sp.]